MTFKKTTEQSSKYEHLEKMTVQELLSNINQEDITIPLAVEKASELLAKYGSVRKAFNNFQSEI